MTSDDRPASGAGTTAADGGTDAPRDGGAVAPPRFVALVVLFATGLAAAQFLAAKVVAVPLPAALPGEALVVPAGVVAYAVTYFATDCVGELYGRRAARRLVAAGAGALPVLFALAWVAVLAPAGPAGASQAAFEAVVGSSTNIVVASMAAYLASQTVDVALFHRLRAATSGRHLWLRNVGSTAVAQGVDTAVFVGLGFVVVPALTGVGVALPLAAAGPLAVGQYVVKLGIVALDTPLVYLATGTRPGADGADPVPS